MHTDETPETEPRVVSTPAVCVAAVATFATTFFAARYFTKKAERDFEMTMVDGLATISRTDTSPPQDPWPPVHASMYAKPCQN